MAVAFAGFAVTVAAHLASRRSMKSWVTCARWWEGMGLVYGGEEFGVTTHVDNHPLEVRYPKSLEWPSDTGATAEEQLRESPGILAVRLP